MPKSRTLVSLIAVPLLALLIACGGGDDDDDSSSSSSSGNGDSPSATQSSGGGTSNNNNSSSNNDDDDDIDLEDCPELLGLAGLAGGFNPGATGNLNDDLEFTGDFFQELADNVPNEIKADMQIVADGFSEFFDLLEDLDIDFSNPASFATLSASDIEELEEISEKLDTPRFNQAIDKVEAYFEEKCS